MPEAEQVLDGGRDARGLVGVDGGVAAVGIAVRDDDRHAGGDVEAGPVEDLGLDDGEAVDGLVGEPSDGALDGLLGLVLDADHVDRVAGGLGGPGDGGEGPGVALRGDVEGHHPEGVEAPEGEGPGRAVALVAEHAHGGQHPLAGLGFDVGPVVGDPGDCLRGHPREGCHVGLGRRAPRGTRGSAWLRHAVHTGPFR